MTFSIEFNPFNDKFTSLRKEYWRGDLLKFVKLLFLVIMNNWLFFSYVKFRGLRMANVLELVILATQPMQLSQAVNLPL